jgi:hypothetical protein
LLADYRAHPTDLYLLRAGYGGVMGPLTNIDEKGFASAAFHSFPDRMAFDAYTGDYGPNFVGHALNTATYLTHDDQLGWLCFGGNVNTSHGTVTFTTLDSFRNRVFLAPLGLWLTLDAGHFSSVDYDGKHKTIRLHLAPRSDGVTVARLRVEQTANLPGALPYQAPASWRIDAGAYVLPLQATETVVELQAK